MIRSTNLADLTPEERRLLFPAFVAVPVEVLYRGAYVPAVFEALCEPAGAVVLLKDCALLAPLSDIRITHETLHALVRLYL